MTDTNSVSIWAVRTSLFVRSMCTSSSVVIWSCGWYSEGGEEAIRGCELRRGDDKPSPVRKPGSCRRVAWRGSLSGFEYCSGPSFTSIKSARCMKKDPKMPPFFRNSERGFNHRSCVSMDWRASNSSGKFDSWTLRKDLERSLGSLFFSTKTRHARKWFSPHLLPLVFNSTWFRQSSKPSLSQVGQRRLSWAAVEGYFPGIFNCDKVLHWFKHEVEIIVLYVRIRPRML